MIAIIPAAGKGTRMASITHGAPKELLKLGRRTVIDWAIREAQFAGAYETVVVSSEDKPTLNEALANRQSVRVAFQPLMRGMADAVAVADPEDDALILVGDTVYHGGSPLGRMAELLRKGMAGCIAVEPTDDAGTCLYGIAEVDEWSGQITRILEKPGPEATTSRWAVAGRYGLSIGVMARLSQFVHERMHQTSEIGITDFLIEEIERRTDFKAVALQPGQTRVDCGSPEEYRAAIHMDWSE